MEYSAFWGEEFDAEAFAARLRLGEFDLVLGEVLRNLSTPQLEKVADILMTKQPIKTPSINESIESTLAPTLTDAHNPSGTS